MSGLIIRKAAGQLITLAARATAEWHILRFRLFERASFITFQQAAEQVGAIPQVFGYRVRERFYQRLLARCGHRIEVNFGATIGEQETTIDDDVWIGPNTYIDLAEIGAQVLIAPHVCILAGGNHHRTDRVDVPIRLQGNHPLRRTRIGMGAWIGANAVVMADVGEGAIVGAGAVVTKPVPPYAVAAGNPARVIRYRTPGGGDGARVEAPVEGAPT